MVEDKQHLQLFDEIARQLEEAVVGFNRRANGVTDRDELLMIRREQNEVLAEAVARHRRAMNALEGKPIEPQVHFGESVLIGVGGGIT
jgi:hypothetical protein